MAVKYIDLKSTLWDARGFYLIFCEFRKEMPDEMAYNETEVLCVAIFGRRRYDPGGFVAFRRIYDLFDHPSVPE